MEKKTLGAFIALLRKEKGLTQKQLAELLNVSDKTVSHWECDETSPDISLLTILAQTLGVTVDELLQGEKKSVQPTVEHHYIPPKGESILDKAEHLATKAASKIKNEISSDIKERYRYFRLLSLIGTVISLVVLLSVTFTTLSSAQFVAASSIMVGAVALIGSLWTIAISLGFTIGARFLFSKELRPNGNADEKEKEYIYKANGVCYNNIFLVLCIFPMALTGINVFPVGTNILIALVFLAVLRIILTAVLTKTDIIRTSTKKMLIIKYGCIFIVSAIIVGGALWFFKEELWFPTPENIIFDNSADFIAYMETPKAKPDNAYLIEGVTASTHPPTMPAPGHSATVDSPVGIGQIPSDVAAEAVGESVLGYCGGGLITFKWLNQEVSDCTYNEEEGTFHVITYEAEIKAKDLRLLVDDGVPIAVFVFTVADALTCLFLYKKNLRKLIEM